MHDTSKNLGPITTDGARSLLASASPALAQDDALKREALQRFQDGTALMSDGKHELARAKFVQAYAGARLPNVVFNLARCEHLTGRYLEATRHYREYLRLVDRKKVSATDLEQVEGWLKASRHFHGQLEITAPAGAYLFVDGERVGDAPLTEPVDVRVGKHSVTAELAGKRLTADAETPAGTVTRVELEEPTAPPSAASAERPASAGQPLESNQAMIVTPPPEEPKGTLWKPVTFVLGGATLVAGGLALYFNAQSHNAADEASAARRDINARCGIAGEPEQCAGLRNAREDQKAAAEAAKAFWIGTAGLGALSVTSLILWLTDPHPSRSGALLPSVAPGFAGATYLLSF